MILPSAYPSATARRAIRIAMTAALLAPPGGAVTYVVTKTADTADGTCALGDCSLREAVIAANDNPGADVVEVPAGTYPLTRTTGSDPEDGDLDLLDPVTIRTPFREPDPAIIQTDLSERLFSVGSTGVTLRHLVLQGGGPEVFGGGIYVLDGGAVTLENCEVRDSDADYGAGLLFGLGSQGTLIDTIVAGNTATFVGGGIHAGASESLTLLRSALEDNSAGEDGGGLYARGAVTLTLSSVSQNEAGEYGGGIQVGGETTTIEDSTISTNTAGFHGGGIAGNGAVILRRSLVINNRATNGGGIHRILAAGLEVTNSTFVLNTATNHGGALFLDSTSAQIISSSTLAVNLANSDGLGAGTGGGLYTGTTGVTLHNSLIANNLGTSALPDDCFGLVDSLGYNLIEDPFACVLSGVLDGNLIGVDPMLSLGDHGGPTLTFLPISGSPAIDAGDPAGCVGGDGTPLPTDQRGFTRALDQDGAGGARCDIGAVESSLFADGFESGDTSVWTFEAS